MDIIVALRRTTYGTEPSCCIVNRIEKAAPDPIRIKHITRSSKENLYEFKRVIELAFGNTKRQNLKDLGKTYVLGPGNFQIGNNV